MYQISQKFISIEGQSRLVYGILGEGVSIDDISTDYDKVHKIVEILNKERPSPIHITEIVEDFLAMSDF